MALTDPMMFETVRDAIETLLQTYETGYFRTITGQPQSLSAEDFKGTQRTISVFYESGDYPKGTNSMSKLSAHDCTYKLEYYVSSPCKADLSVLDDPSASAALKQVAIANLQVAFKLVDALMDEFRRIITQIIMAPNHQDLGLARFTVSNRWLNNFRKAQPIDRGRLVELNAAETLTCRVTETLTGVTPVTAVQPIISAIIDQQPLDGTTVLEPPDVGIDTLQ